MGKNCVLLCKRIVPAVQIAGTFLFFAKNMCHVIFVKKETNRSWKKKKEKENETDATLHLALQEIFGF